MPKRPGRERGKEYDRFGRPIEGITTTESLAEQTGAEAIPDVDGDDIADGETED